jgi:hypothetical protein
MAGAYRSQAARRHGREHPSFCLRALGPRLRNCCSSGVIRAVCHNHHKIAHPSGRAVPQLVQKAFQVAVVLFRWPPDERFGPSDALGEGLSPQVI